MMKPQVLSEIKRVILQQEPGAEIILYGSYARGDYQADSDIDILILIDKSTVTREDENKIAHRLYDLELNTQQVISPLIRTKKNWHEKYPNTALFVNINKEGIRI